MLIIGLSNFIFGFVLFKVENLRHFLSKLLMIHLPQLLQNNSNNQIYWSDLPVFFMVRQSTLPLLFMVKNVTILFSNRV